MWFALDYSRGFGGRYGVETDKQDKSAVGWEYQAHLAKHESQQGQLLFLLIAFYATARLFQV